MKKIFLGIVFLTILALSAMSCGRGETMQSGSMTISVDGNMRLNVTNGMAKQALIKPEKSSEYLTLKDGVVDKFKLKSSARVASDEGETLTIVGEATLPYGKIEQMKVVSTYKDFPNFLTTKIVYVNKSNRDVHVKGWTNNAYEVLSGESTPAFWSFQGQSTSARADWILPVDDEFSQRNFMGLNNSDYGGGIPITALWRQDAGVAVGHVELVPQLVSLPVEKSRYETSAHIAVAKDYDDGIPFNIGDTLQTITTFVSIYTGDCFMPLRQFSEFMQSKGIVMPEPQPDAFEAAWCAWGYERNFTFEEVLGTLPKVKELGIKWATVDDGYQIAEGDWELDPKRFPGGDGQMINLVKKMKSYGLKVQLWWAPLAADPGTRVLAKNPCFASMDKSGAPHYITWWDSYYLSPSNEKVVDYTRDLVRRFVKKYGFDGLKLDGQHLNCTPSDHSYCRDNPNPELNGEALPQFFKMIYEESLAINPKAVVQICPCGCCMSFYNLPYTNQTVSSDPLNSWQIRLKGHVYKALVPKTAYFGDHVELSDNGNDFASSFGVGAVLGTKFTYPKNNPTVKQDYLLTPEKERVWKKWFSLYNDMMLSKGEYVGGVYDIGYDYPETHLVKKDGVLHYAFYAPDFDGEILIKGLEEGKKYRLYDYFNNVEVATNVVNGASVPCEFKQFLLVKAAEVK